MTQLRNSDNLRICAVISTYRPDNEFPRRVDLVSQQVGSVIIVNDSDSIVIHHLLFQWFEQNKTLSNVILHTNDSNMGVSASLNVGLKLAIKLGFNHFLFLDDDTTVMPGLVEKLIYYKDRVNKESKTPVGIISMSGIPIGETLEDTHSYGEQWQDKRGVITSGSFFDLHVVNAVACFREEFIIDAIDYDYCLRARKKGFRVIKIMEPGIFHTIGKNLGKNSFDENEYKYRRLYYSIRNGTVLAKEYLFSDPLYTVAVIITQLRIILIILFTESCKSRKLKCVIHGYRDAILNRMGKRK
jgi:rhamnosyltransferase